jgi:enediyne biosynthesis protein E4
MNLVVNPYLRRFEYVIQVSACLVFLSLQGADLNWQSGPGYRFAPLTIPQTGEPGFESVPAVAAGISFQNTLALAYQIKNHNLLNGSGLALGDVDGDGRCDLYLCRLSGPNALYRNLGNWKFQEIASKAGVDLPRAFSRGATFADVDGDGDLDLVVTFSGTGAKLFLNDGRGKFTPHKPKSLFGRNGATSPALADIDNDGDLDLYITNYGEETIRSGTNLDFRMRGNKMIITGRWRNRIRVIDNNPIEFGEPDRLYLNDGSGNFSLIPWTKGHFRDENGQVMQSDPWDMGLSVMFRDINQDQHPDIYVCNDFQQPDRLWINDGNGRFQAIARSSIRVSPYFSMGVDFGDLNRDGLDDFMVVDMKAQSHALRMTQIAPITPPLSETLEAAFDRPQYRRNMVYLNRGDGTYAEIAQLAGLQASDWTWCPVFLDVDLDGYEDILTVNGHAFDTQDLDTITFNRQFPKDSPRRKKVHQFPPLRTPNAAFRSRRDLTFEEVGKEWGFDSKEVSHGIGLADLDNDGDLDIVVNCLNAAPLLYRNTVTQPRLAIRLKGANGNTAGIGARIIVREAGGDQSQEMICGGRYLSSDDALRTFACLSAGQSMTIDVHWRSGRKDSIQNVRSNHIYEIIESSGNSPLSSDLKKSLDHNQTPLFIDLSENIGHRHRDTKFNDFVRQPSLTRSLSDLGPAMVCIDLDEDADDDLVIGTGRGGRLTVLMNDGQGAFRDNPRFRSQPEKYDLVGIVALGSPASGPAFVAGASNYEFPFVKPSVIRIYSRTGQRMEIPLPDPSVSIGPLALGDVDRDGDLDLFVGGRCCPSRYPKPVSSYLFENVQGQFRFQQELSEPLRNIGNVSGATWSDINSDGWLDLVLACDHGPVRLFLNEKGRLAEKTQEWDLSDAVGLWSGVATGDFNNDGRPDLIVSNWGQNHRHQIHRHHPIVVRYGDTQGDGVVDAIQGYFSVERNEWAPYRMREPQSRVVSSIPQRFATHQAYSQAALSEIWEPGIDYTDVTLRSFESTLFINRGNEFESQPLPIEAQMAPGTSVCIADFNGDGNEDVFLGQNVSAMSSEISALNAGRGLMLEGDGQGTFRPLSGAESGIRVYGDQRGAAVGDFNGDGRPDLVVSQNNDAIHLYQNATGKPGRRFRLQGGAENPAAIGASIRLVTRGTPGPQREIQAGSGYWSQNTLAPILSLEESTEEIWVRWPDGSESTTSVPGGISTIVLSQNGQAPEIPDETK